MWRIVGLNNSIVGLNNSAAKKLKCKCTHERIRNRILIELQKGVHKQVPGPQR